MNRSQYFNYIEEKLSILSCRIQIREKSIYRIIFDMI